MDEIATFTSNNILIRQLSIQVIRERLQETKNKFIARKQARKQLH